MRHEQLAHQLISQGCTTPDQVQALTTAQVLGLQRVGERGLDRLRQQSLVARSAGHRVLLCLLTMEERLSAQDLDRLRESARHAEKNDWTVVGAITGPLSREFALKWRQAVKDRRKGDFDLIVWPLALSMRTDSTCTAVWEAGRGPRWMFTSFVSTKPAGQSRGAG